MFKLLLNHQSYRLEALKPSHKEGLKKAAQDISLWKYVKPNHIHLDTFFEQYYQDMLQHHLSNEPFAYVVIENKSNNIVGSSRYYQTSVPDKRTCVGFTWYQRSAWGTGINPEIKYLLLSQVFDNLEWNRVEFHVDSRNARSLLAMSYLGSTKEGVLRKHKIVQENYVRDTVVFSIIKEDWPIVKNKLLARIN